MANTIFRDTERQLTRRYLLLISLFLIAFIALTYFICYFTLMSQEKRSITNLLEQDQQMLENRMQQEGQSLVQLATQKPNITSQNQIFYYVTDRHQNIIAQNEFKPEKTSGYLSLIKNKFPGNIALYEQNAMIEAPHHNFKKEDKPKPGHEQKSENNNERKEANVLIGATPIHQNHQIVGYLYVGKNMTAIHQLMNNVLIVLIAMLILFILIGYFLSRTMSKRAMVPIERAYEKEKAFVSNASHELRTPLAVLLSATELLEIEDAVEQHPETMKTVQTMKHEINRLKDLVTNLLFIARNDANIQTETTSFNTQPELERLTKQLSLIANEKGVSIQLNTQPANISFNLSQFQQMALIIIDNAIKYTKPNTKIIINSQINNKSYILTVEDHGNGIDPSDLQKIFDRFYRSDKARNRTGHGLGLSIAKQIIASHKGTISAENTEHGAKFIVKIPV